MLQNKEVSAPDGTVIQASPLGGANLFAEVRDVTSKELAPLASSIDSEGVYPETVLRKYGELGAFAQHTSAFGANGKPDLMGAIDAMAIAGEECLSTAS